MALPAAGFSLTVLMLDDNKLGLVARKAVMEELGYTVVAALSPAEALDVAKSNNVDLVITDYRMPQMNGAEFIRRLREQGTRSPVILISGFVDALGLNKANTGADAVIQKSAHEVSQMLRAAKSLLKGAAHRKPPARAPGRGRKSAKSGGVAGGGA